MKVNFFIAILLKFMRSMCTKDEFELEKDRIDITTGQEKVLLEKIVVVLQSDF